jgi:hypothetical protein
VEDDLLALGVSVFPVLVGHANFVQASGRATAYQAEGDAGHAVRLAVHLHVTESPAGP